MISFGLPRNDVVQIVCDSYEELPAVERDGTIGRVRTDEGEDVYVYWDGWHPMGGEPQEGDVPVRMMIFDTSSGTEAVLVGISDEYVAPADGYELVVPATYDGLPVKGVGKTSGDVSSPYIGCVAFSSESIEHVDESAFRACSSLVSVDLPAVTSVGSSAFTSCRSLRSLDLPAVTSVGAPQTFSFCSSLTSVSLPALTMLTSYAFEGCTSLASVDMPLLEQTYPYAFKDCTSLASVSLPALTSVGANTFQGCTSLSDVDLPSVTNVGSSSFAGCTSLVSVDLPAATIRDKVFSTCSSLKHVRLPNVTSVGSQAFYWCKAIQSVLLGPLSTVGSDSFPNWTFYASDGTTVLDKKVAANLAGKTFEGAAAALVEVPQNPGRRGQ